MLCAVCNEVFLVNVRKRSEVYLLQRSKLKAVCEQEEDIGIKGLEILWFLLKISHSHEMNELHEEVMKWKMNEQEKPFTDQRLHLAILNECQIKKGIS